jgi:hypothetical protein
MQVSEHEVSHANAQTSEDIVVTTFRIAYIACSSTTAICALVAAVYWYLSSRPTPTLSEVPEASISDAPELYTMNAQIDVYAVRDALIEASTLNKKAAIWSAVAALFGAAAAIFGIL